MTVSETTILVIEDDPRGRELLAAQLRPLGHRLELTDNGTAGLVKARELVPDIILSDVMMPEMTGFEVCQAVRADPRLKEVPILLITALDDRASRIEGIEAGADEFISKPFDGNELRARIRMISKLNRFRGILAEKEKFQRVVDLAPTAIFVLNERLEIVFANQTAAELFNSSDELPLVGTRFPFLIEELPFAAFDGDLFRHVNETGTAVRFAGSFIRLNNERFPAEGSVGPFSWEEAPALQVNIADVTAIRRLETELLRTQRLHGLGSIAGGVAHDLNNVLTPIVMAAEALVEKVNDDISREMVKTIVEAGARGAGLVKQVLTFARGRQAEMVPVSLKHVAGEVRRLLAESLPRDIRLKVWLSKDDLTVLGNATELIQVVMNLCVNARDAMPEGGTIELRCAAKSSDTGASLVHLSVTDSGIGMTPEVIGKIGKTIFTTKPEGQGTGLGLPTVQTILKRHESELKVRSEVGKGSVFSASFRAVRVDEGEEEDAVRDVRIHGHGELILICDDDAAVREILANAISCHGFEVLSAGDGAEATALYSQHGDRIAALVTDLHLPYLDGVGVIRAIRRMGGDLPVVVMTTERNDRLREEIEDHGAAFLAKPFTTTDLLSAVSAAVRKVTT
jgi:two-component system, cell cycle sensor histidine kinase and response regulator CckA